MFRFLLLSFALLLLPNLAGANPVSFKDGWGFMPAYSNDWSDVDLNYSFSRSDAVGVSNFYRDGRDSSADFAILRYNRLLKRWNELDSQANIYASAGVGGRHDSQHGDAAAGFFALEGNYETRRLYTMLGFESLQSGSAVQFNRTRARVGVAPYTAPVDELQTWLVAQIEYAPEMSEKWSVTPLLRFFYNNVALEVGCSFEGDLYIAGMAHF
ncbi:MAG: hypothetical protein J0M12_15130 [Deltaproteobacteria bacterium]|nr:hypothetical protein [Deltaproteobacteria bacterium]